MAHDNDIPGNSNSPHGKGGFFSDGLGYIVPCGSPWPAIIIGGRISEFHLAQNAEVNRPLTVD